MTSPRLLRAGTAAAFVLAIACGGSNSTSTASAVAAPNASASSAASPPAQASAGRPLAGFHVCDFVPAADVARVLGGTPVTATGQPGEKFQADCMYTVKIGAITKTAQIWLYPPDQFAGMKETATGPVDAVGGMGDEAYGVNDSGVYQVVVHRPGDVTLDARADTPQQARAVADLAIAKLTAEPPR